MELNALKIFDLLKYKTGLFMYKANKNLLPKNFLNLSVHMYGHLHIKQTGNFQQFDLRTPPPPQIKKRIYIDGPKLWNSMETIIKEETGIYMTKHRYKQIIMESYIKNLYSPLIDMWYKDDTEFS